GTIGADGRLGVCEGIETGLAVMTACSGLPVWSALSTSHLEQVMLPPAAREIVILADQWSPRYTSWENPQVRTPNLDEIAAGGMIFDACYTTSPVCMPARVSLLTGLYPHNHGHALWGNALGYYAVPESAPMFRDIQAAGYTTAQIGKTHWTGGNAWRTAFDSLTDYHRALGLDRVVDIPGPVDSPKDRSAYGRHLAGIGLLESVAEDIRKRYVDGEFEPRASLAGPEDYHDGVTTRIAVEHILAQPRDKPICLVVSLHSPHPPLDAPGEYATMFDPETLVLPDNVPESFLREGKEIDRALLRRMLANYLGKIAFVDRCIGELVGAMRERGTWDSALVCVTSDHGEMMGAHGALTKGRFYEESVRVPLVVRWPGKVVPGRSGAPVQMMDVYPTLVEAGGGIVSPRRFAKSLLPIATGEKKTIRPLAVSEIGDTAPLRIMARDERYKYWADEDREYLFDLKNDPYEQTDLSGDPASLEVLHAMREKLLVHLRSTQVNYSEGYKSKVQRLREAEVKEANE
ncbi:MAG: sulfatase-like hydrolase/transferase, partial [Verrucomicrobiales bacterium]